MSNAANEVAGELGRAPAYVQKLLRDGGMSAPYADRRAVLTILAQRWPEAKALLDKELPEDGGNGKRSRLNHVTPEMERRAIIREESMRVMQSIHQDKRMKLSRGDAALLYLNARIDEDR